MKNDAYYRKKASSCPLTTRSPSTKSGSWSGSGARSATRYRRKTRANASASTWTDWRTALSSARTRTWRCRNASVCSKRRTSRSCLNSNVCRRFWLIIPTVRSLMEVLVVLLMGVVKIMPHSRLRVFWCSCSHLHCFCYPIWDRMAARASIMALLPSRWPRLSWKCHLLQVLPW